MVTVHGYIDGVYYAVTVGEPRPEATATIGVVSGSRRACLLLELRKGLPLPVSGQVLDVTDPETVLAALHELTDVRRVEQTPPG
ncbi:hypothetical protein SAMN05421505_12040 [Sinosporangium album]|uniref:Uncharacterized protein n=1 Tax=Sinosporangium album TaxID=504805 RepID=A0A1G8ED54_9ACTN|nr:hypothetical protein [Sinosporangium album]SDH67629.1 hypothetical protein SAMN05421505_12040 [Sinosporangium album]